MIRSTALLALILFATAPADAATFHVLVTSDRVDASPGDGACLGEPPIVLCSLRAAVMEANALPGSDVIVLSATTYPLAIPQDAFCPGENSSEPAQYSDDCADLDVLEDLTIRGAGIHRTVIDASAIQEGFNSGIFDVTAGATLVLEDLALVEGHTRGSGGAIRSRGGDLEIRRVQLFSNEATYAGGAIEIRDADLRVEDSVFANNRAFTGSLGGGAIYHGGGGSGTPNAVFHNSTFHSNIAGGGNYDPNSDQNGGALSLWDVDAEATQVTLHNNYAYFKGGGIILSAGASLTLLQSTVTGNYSDYDNDSSGGSGAGAGGIEIETGSSLTIGGTILAKNVGPDTAGNPGADDCHGTVTSLGSNFVGNNHTCSGFHIGGDDIVGMNDSPLDPLLQSLGLFGGAIPVRVPVHESPVVDAGDDLLCTESSDPRGLPRRVDGDGNFSFVCDIGAAEWGPTRRFDVLVSEDLDQEFSPFGCAATHPAGFRTCALRGAVSQANSLVDPVVVGLDEGTFSLTLAGAGEDDNETGDLDVSSPLTIIGAGAGLSHIDGNDLDRVFDVRPGVLDDGELTLFGVTVLDGTAPAGENGGLVRVTLGADLTVRRSQLEAGRATGGGSGGAVHHSGAGTTEIDQSTLWSNATVATTRGVDPGDGGAVAQTGGVLRIEDSTLLENDSAGDGGAVASSGGSTSLDHVTAIENSAVGAGGGIFRGAGIVSLQDSIVARNSAGSSDDCAASVFSNGFNLLVDATGCTGLESSDRIGVDPGLDTPADNGGGMLTALPEAVSPVVDAADPSSCSNQDQRSVARPIDGDGDGDDVCDLGAVEYDGPVTPRADLRVLELVVDPGVVAEGGSVAMTLAVENAGAAEATDLVVAVDLPGSVSATSTDCDGLSATADGFELALGGFSPGASESCEIGLVVSDPASGGVHQIVATATSGTLELDPADNTASTTLEITVLTLFDDGFESGDVSAWTSP